MADDPFSEILELVEARSAIAGGFVAGGRWAIRFPAPDRIKFFVAARGACWLRVEGEASPFRLREGDVFLLAAARSFELSSDLDVPAVDARVLFGDGSSELRHVGDGDEFLFFGGHVQFASGHGQLLVESLPALLHLPAGSSEAGTLKWLIEKLVEECRVAQPGSSFASTQLAQLMFLQILRTYVAGAGPGVPGRLRVLADRRLSPAVRRMHGEPGRPWQVEELARLAGMSRTAFAVHFKAVAGVAPLAYLTEWRMRLAEREIGRTDVSFAELASSLGYASESAFSTAFKRVTGTSPKFFRSSSRKRRHERTGT